MAKSAVELFEYAEQINSKTEFLNVWGAVMSLHFNESWDFFLMTSKQKKKIIITSEFQHSIGKQLVDRKLNPVYLEFINSAGNNLFNPGLTLDL